MKKLIYLFSTVFLILLLSLTGVFAQAEAEEEAVVISDQTGEEAVQALEVRDLQLGPKGTVSTLTGIAAALNGPDGSSATVNEDQKTINITGKIEGIDNIYVAGAGTFTINVADEASVTFNKNCGFIFLSGNNVTISGNGTLSTSGAYPVIYCKNGSNLTVGSGTGGPTIENTSSNLVSVNGVEGYTPFAIGRGLDTTYYYDSSATEQITITGKSTVQAMLPIVINNHLSDSTLNITGGTITQAGIAQNRNYSAIQVGSSAASPIKVNIEENGTIGNTNLQSINGAYGTGLGVYGPADINITGGTINGYSKGNGLYLQNSNITVQMSGGTITDSSPSPESGDGISARQGAQVNITGGTINYFSGGISAIGNGSVINVEPNTNPDQSPKIGENETIWGASVFEGGVVNISGGTINGTSAGITSNGTDRNPNTAFNVTGGIVSGGITGAYLPAATTTISGDAQITGNSSGSEDLTSEGGFGIVIRGGNLIINGGTITGEGKGNSAIASPKWNIQPSGALIADYPGGDGYQSFAVQINGGTFSGAVKTTYQGVEKVLYDIITVNGGTFSELLNSAFVNGKKVNAFGQSGENYVYGQKTQLSGVENLIDFTPVTNSIYMGVLSGNSNKLDFSIGGTTKAGENGLPNGWGWINNLSTDNSPVLGGYVGSNTSNNNYGLTFNGLSITTADKQTSTGVNVPIPKLSLTLNSNYILEANVNLSGAVNTNQPTQIVIDTPGNRIIYNITFFNPAQATGGNTEYTISGDNSAGDNIFNYLEEGLAATQFDIEGEGETQINVSQSDFVGEGDTTSGDVKLTLSGAITTPPAYVVSKFPAPEITQGTTADAGNTNVFGYLSVLGNSGKVTINLYTDYELTTDNFIKVDGSSNPYLYSYQIEESSLPLTLPISKFTFGEEQLAFSAWATEPNGTTTYTEITKDNYKTLAGNSTPSTINLYAQFKDAVTIATTENFTINPNSLILTNLEPTKSLTLTPVKDNKISGQTITGYIYLMSGSSLATLEESTLPVTFSTDGASFTDTIKVGDDPITVKVDGTTGAYDFFKALTSIPNGIQNYGLIIYAYGDGITPTDNAQDMVPNAVANGFSSANSICDVKTGPVYASMANQAVSIPVNPGLQFNNTITYYNLSELEYQINDFKPFVSNGTISSSIVGNYTDNNIKVELTGTPGSSSQTFTGTVLEGASIGNSPDIIGIQWTNPDEKEATPLAVPTKAGNVYNQETVTLQNAITENGGATSGMPFGGKSFTITGVTYTLPSGEFNYPSNTSTNPPYIAPAIQISGGNLKTPITLFNLDGISLNQDVTTWTVTDPQLANLAQGSYTLTMGIMQNGNNTAGVDGYIKLSGDITLNVYSNLSAAPVYMGVLPTNSPLNSQVGVQDSTALISVSYPPSWGDDAETLNATDTWTNGFGNVSDLNATVTALDQKKDDEGNITSSTATIEITCPPVLDISSYSQSTLTLTPNGSGAGLSIPVYFFNAKTVTLAATNTLSYITDFYFSNNQAGIGNNINTLNSTGTLMEEGSPFSGYQTDRGRLTFNAGDYDSAPYYLQTSGSGVSINLGSQTGFMTSAYGILAYCINETGNGFTWVGTSDDQTQVDYAIDYQTGDIGASNPGSATISGLNLSDGTGLSLGWALIGPNIRPVAYSGGNWPSNLPFTIVSATANIKAGGSNDDSITVTFKAKSPYTWQNLTEDGYQLYFYQAPNGSTVINNTFLSNNKVNPEENANINLTILPKPDEYTAYVYYAPSELKNGATTNKVTVTLSTGTAIIGTGNYSVGTLPSISESSDEITTTPTSGTTFQFTGDGDVKTANIEISLKVKAVTDVKDGVTIPIISNENSTNYSSKAPVANIKVISAEALPVNLYYVKGSGITNSTQVVNTSSVEGLTNAEATTYTVSNTNSENVFIKAPVPSPEAVANGTNQVTSLTFGLNSGADSVSALNALTGADGKNVGTVAVAQANSQANGNIAIGGNLAEVTVNVVNNYTQPINYVGVTQNTPSQRLITVTKKISGTSLSDLSWSNDTSLTTRIFYQGNDITGSITNNQSGSYPVSSVSASIPTSDLEVSLVAQTQVSENYLGRYEIRISNSKDDSNLYKNTVIIPVVFFDVAEISVGSTNSVANLDYTVDPGFSFDSENGLGTLTYYNSDTGAVVSSLSNITPSVVTAGQSFTTGSANFTTKTTSVPTGTYNAYADGNGITLAGDSSSPTLYGCVTTINVTEPAQVVVEAPKADQPGIPEGVTPSANFEVRFSGANGLNAAPWTPNGVGDNEPKDNVSGTQIYTAVPTGNATFLFWLVYPGAELSDVGTQGLTARAMAAGDPEYYKVYNPTLVLQVTDKNTVIAPVFTESETVKVTLKPVLNPAGTTPVTTVKVNGDNVSTGTIINVIPNQVFTVTAPKYYNGGYIFQNFSPQSGAIGLAGNSSATVNSANFVATSDGTLIINYLADLQNNSANTLTLAVNPSNAVANFKVDGVASSPGAQITVPYDGSVTIEANGTFNGNKLSWSPSESNDNVTIVANGNSIKVTFNNSSSNQPSLTQPVTANYTTSSSEGSGGTGGNTPGGGSGGGTPPSNVVTIKTASSPVNGGSTNIPNGRSVTPGTTVIVSAAPASGYTFTGWYNGTTLVSTNNPYSYVVNSNITLTAHFAQSTPEAPSITLEPDSLKLDPGQSGTVKVTVDPEIEGDTVIVRSSDDNIATASYDPDTGEITVVAGQTPGTAIISVSYGGTTTTFEVTVGNGEAPTPTAIEITPDPLYLTTITGGKTTGQLVAEATPDGADLTGLTWSISPTTVATIDPDTGIVTAKAPGQATVTATLGNLTATSTVIVNDNPVICSSIIASGSTPDTFTVTVSGVKANPALDVMGSVNNVSIFTWTGPDQNDMQCVRVLSPVAPGSDTYAYQPFQVNGDQQYYFNADNIYVQAYGSLDSTQGNYLGSGSNYSWVNPETASTNSVAYITYQENNAFNRPTVFNGAISGETGKHLQLEGLRVSSNIEGVEVVTDVHEENIGWVEAVHDGVYAGTQHQHRQLEAIKLRLEGENAQNYDIYYQVHAEDKGWMGPVGATQIAGTVGEHRQIESIQVQIVPKGTVPTGWATN